MHLHQSASTNNPVRRQTSGVNDGPSREGPSREGLVEKLNDARCKWMVTLHRYSSKIHHGNVHQDAVRETNVCRSSTPGRGLVPAADFCPKCGSIVPVELECSSDGEFVAEHRRGCSVCESGQRTDLASATKTGTRIFRRRRFLDQDWRLWKDQITVSQQERGQFSIPRRSDHEPNALFVAAEDPPAKSTNRHVADSFEAKSETRTHGSAESRETGRLGCEDPGTEIREVMTPSASRANRNSTSTNRTPTDGSDLASSDQASSNSVHSGQTSGGQAGTSGGASRSEGTLPAEGEWAEQIREKDELISTLKRQLTALGEQPIEEVVTLEEAKKRLREAIDALMDGDASAEVEHAMEKWDKYVTNHPDHIKEQAAEEQAWEAENEPKNNEALHLMKTFVPPNIFHAGLDGLREGGLPPALAKRIFDRKVIWLIRAPKGMVSKTHVVELKSKFLANDLDVVESRALHACLPSTFENDADGAKTAWRAGFRERLKGLLGKEASGQIKPAETRRPVYKDLAKGPFDPDAAAEEQETMRSSAFDASEKPVVGGKLTASKIAVIGDGLAAKLKPSPLPLKPGADFNTGPDAEEATRSAPNSPASKYRRQSYALSRAQPTACSMKNMMSELGNRLSNRRLNQRRTSSFNGSLDMSKLLQGTLDPVMSFTGPVAEHGETASRPDDSSSEESTSEVETGLEVDPVFPGLQSPGVPALSPTSQELGVAAKKNGSRPGGQSSPPSMKDMMGELASKAKAREERSSSPPSQTTKQPADGKSDGTVKKNGSRQSSPPSMKDMMGELASKAKAREERSASPTSQVTKQPADGKSDITVKKNGSRPGGQSSPPSMKDMMGELASKAKAREERSASPPSQTTKQPADGKSDGTVKKSGSRPGGQSSPPSMKDMMGELASKAKAREERSASPPSQTTTAATHTSRHLAEPAHPKAIERGTPLPSPPPPSRQQQERAGASAKVKKNTAKANKPVSMKEIMSELEMKATARANRNIA